MELSLWVDALRSYQILSDPIRSCELELFFEHVIFFFFLKKVSIYQAITSIYQVVYWIPTQVMFLFSIPATPCNGTRHTPTVHVLRRPNPARLGDLLELFGVLQDVCPGLPGKPNSWLLFFFFQQLCTKKKMFYPLVMENIAIKIGPFSSLNLPYSLDW